MVLLLKYIYGLKSLFTILKISSRQTKYIVKTSKEAFNQIAKIKTLNSRFMWGFSRKAVVFVTLWIHVRTRIVQSTHLFPNFPLLYSTKYLGVLWLYLFEFIFFLRCVGCPVLGQSKYTMETNFQCQMTKLQSTKATVRSLKVFFSQRWRPIVIALNLLCMNCSILYL